MPRRPVETMHLFDTGHVDASHHRTEQMDSYVRVRGAERARPDANHNVSHVTHDNYGLRTSVQDRRYRKTTVPSDVRVEYSHEALASRKLRQTQKIKSTAPTPNPMSGYITGADIATTNNMMRMSTTSAVRPVSDMTSTQRLDFNVPERTRAMVVANGNGCEDVQLRTSFLPPVHPITGQPKDLKMCSSYEVPPTAAPSFSTVRVSANVVARQAASQNTLPPHMWSTQSPPTKMLVSKTTRVIM
eukprot:PhM_4_TR4714/c0_g1_i1/m.63882